MEQCCRLRIGEGSLGSAGVHLLLVVLEHLADLALLNELFDGDACEAGINAEAVTQDGDSDHLILWYLITQLVIHRLRSTGLNSKGRISVVRKR